MPAIKHLKTLLLTLCIAGSNSLSADINLPTIGDTSSSVVSVQREQEIGSIFLKMLNSQLATESDPELVDYIESLVYRLAEASQLQDRRLSIILVDSPHLNAFAAPGGVVGINTGLFFYAHTEEEFASVVAHELAHLSQRHYARGVEAAQRQSLPTMAALLGSIILAATGAGDLGMAALSSTMAGAQSSQLAFSRTNEQEADHIGILTMARAGMDPRGMATLFERMSKLDGTGPQYEFLRTHPLSRNRVADAKSPSRTVPGKTQPHKQHLRTDAPQGHCSHEPITRTGSQPPCAGTEKWTRTIRKGNTLRTGTGRTGRSKPQGRRESFNPSTQTRRQQSSFPNPE